MVQGSVFSLSDIRLFVLDLDGTVCLGEQPIDGASDFVRDVMASPERDLLFFSNNTSHTAAFYADKLNRMGLSVPEACIMTAGDVCAAYLQAHHPDARVYVNGTGELTAEWEKKGIRLTNERPEIAVQTFDLTMTYEKMERICRHIRAGAAFYATHPDINCPTEDGMIPDCGAMCAMITASTGLQPRCFGKPEKETLEMIKARYHLPSSQIAFVGDRIYTDVAAGVLHGAKGYLVLTGESDEETVRASDIRPTAVFASLKEMRAYLSA